MVTATARGRVLGDVARDVRQSLSGFALPAGYSISFGGRMATLESSGGGLLWVAVLALFLVAVVLVVQYESIVEAAVVLAVLPLSAIGGIGALWLTNTPISSTAIIGMVLLLGISANNAIVLIAFVRQLRRGGYSMRDAVKSGATLRLRPKLMTALTTTAGLVPLAAGQQAGSEILQPLAVTVIGGMPALLIATLIVLPALYIALGDRKIKALS
jgi:multidrug efflux pump subunit AcrB